MNTVKQKKIIITDVDGILVKWQSGLAYFAQKYQLPVENILKLMVADKFIPPAEIFDCDEEFAIRLLMKYNNSDFIRYLAPYSDALKVVNEVKVEYDFVAVTALGNSVDAHLNRQFNLNALFPGAFKDIMVCDYNESKDALLQKARDKYGSKIIAFVDDLGGHIDSAVNVLGDLPDFNAYWLPRGERTEPEQKHVFVNSWEEIIKKIHDKEASSAMHMILNAVNKNSFNDLLLEEAFRRRMPGKYIAPSPSVFEATYKPFQVKQ